MKASVIPIVPAVSIKRILYATDFSAASITALPIAANLARHYRSHLYVTHIWSALPASMISSAAAISTFDQLQKAAVTYRTKNGGGPLQVRRDEETIEAAAKKRKAGTAKRIEQSAKRIKDSRAMIEYARNVILSVGRKGLREGQCEK